MTVYNDCYWSGTPGVYGSARRGLVANPATDADYQAWLLGGARNPWAWPQDDSGAQTIAELDATLVYLGLPVSGLAPPTSAQLKAYATSKANTLIDATKAYGVGPILVADRTSQTIADLLAISTDAETNPTDVYQWVDNADGVTPITASQIATLAPAVAGDRKAIFAMLATVLLAIAAGTITTYAAIDAETWPA